MKNKVSIPVAKESTNFFPMSFAHTTTDQFFRPSVPYVQEVVAGSRVEIKVGTLRRVDPMPVPSFSLVNFVTRFYFVPFIDICPYYHEFKAQTPYSFRVQKDGTTVYSSVIPSKKPWLISGTLLRLFNNALARIEDDPNRDSLSPQEKSLQHYSYRIDLYSYPQRVDDESNEQFLRRILADSDVYNGLQLNPYVTVLVSQIHSYLQDNYSALPAERLTNDVEWIQFQTLNREYTLLQASRDVERNVEIIRDNLSPLIDSGFALDTTVFEDIPDMFKDGYTEEYEFSRFYLPTMRRADFIINSSVVGTVQAPNVNRKSFRCYTERGRVAYKLFKSLGYDYDTWHYGDNSGTEFDAMALLAFLKVIMDYYESSAFINNTQRLAHLTSLLHIDTDGYQLTINDLDLIVDLALYMCYDNDYFTTNMVNPVAGNNSLVNQEGIALQDPTMPGYQSNIVTTNNNIANTPTFATGSQLTRVTSTGLKLLQRLSDYLKRHQIAGGRFVDRILAEYGVSVSNDQSRRTSYIESVKSLLNINPVLNTTSDQLGDYAGYGTSSSAVDARGKITDNIINIDCSKEDGIIIAIDTIVPEISYTQGYDRNNRHVGPMDIYRPSFDGIMPQITEQGELLMAKKASKSYGYVNNKYVLPSDKSFGYTDRYMEYKTKVSRVTGDFICDSVNADIEGYLTNRYFDEQLYLDSNGEYLSITQNRGFVSVYDQGQYNRLFYFDGSQLLERGKTDYVKSVFRFEVKMYAPMHSPFDSYIFDSGGSSVQMAVGGQTMH